jgi:hypothetical protein
VLELASQVHRGVETRCALMWQHHHAVSEICRNAHDLLFLLCSELILEWSTDKLLQCMPVMTRKVFHPASRNQANTIPSKGMACVPPGVLHETVGPDQWEPITLRILQMAMEVSNLCANDIVEQFLGQYGGISSGHLAVERKSTPNDRAELADQRSILDHNFLENMKYLSATSTQTPGKTLVFPYPSCQNCK